MVFNFLFITPSSCRIDGWEISANSTEAIALQLKDQAGHC